MKKLLTEYPLNEWMEAADGCQHCGAKYKVMITWVHESGDFGNVMTQITHKEDCPERIDLETGVDIGEITDHDVAGWEFADKPVIMLGKEFYPLKARANIGPCLNCGKLVVGVPIILFVDEDKEVDLCFPCADQLGFLKALKRSGE